MGDAQRAREARRRLRALALAVAIALAVAVPQDGHSQQLSWQGPQGRSNGACRVAGGGVGKYIELRGKHSESEKTCLDACDRKASCTGYEYVRSGRFYQKCEIHIMPITHIMPVATATCRVKPKGRRPTLSLGPDPSSSPAAGYVPPPDLATCLQAAVTEVHFPWSREWERAKQCRNRRDDIMPKPGGWANPLAVVRAKSAADVSGAVKCVGAAEVDSCARAGAHSFENEGCCPGGVIIDVQDLLEFEYNAERQVVTFGSGMTNGAVYYHMHQHKLTFPGGTEGHVGVAGLTLGCGRGMLTQLYGLSCDQIVAIDYVDSEGDMRTANWATDTDMLWMAKGAGGNLPGIVTAFHSKALREPQEVYGKYCRLDNWKGERILKEWSARIPQLADSSRKMFSHITTFSKVDSWMFDSLCFDCNLYDKNRFHSLINEIVNAAGGGGCYTFTTTWLNKLLAEPGISAVDRPSALLDNGRWPTDHSNSIMGSFMVPNHIDESRVHRVVQHMFKEDPPPGGPYTAQLYIYIMAGDKVNSVQPLDTAYGHRDAKYVLHWRVFSANRADVRERHNQFNRDLSAAGLPCKQYYNYMDGDTKCHVDAAGIPSKARWLDAYFSNVPRMKDIKRRRDSLQVFRSHLSEMSFSLEDSPCGGLPTCTRAVLESHADGLTCAYRIHHLVTAANNNRMPTREAVACNVVGSQYDVCRGCKPTHLPNIE